MPRRPRLDAPGTLHHVMNRGLARRTVFETREDVRRFLLLLACLVRAGHIEVHAYVLMTTHFHLFVRSLDGDISEAIRLVENGYVRWFNRKRRRDGPLFRGRFRSIPVESVRYCHTLIRYIDQNPVEARLAQDPWDYPHGSAGHHVAPGTRPPWLCRDLVDEFVSPYRGAGASRATAYRAAFPLQLTPALRRFVQQRISGLARGPDPLDDLIGAAGAEVRAWMHRKASLADGSRPGLPLVAPETVLGLLNAARRGAPDALVTLGPRTRRSLWDLAIVGLLHDVSGESQASISRRARIPAPEVHRLRAAHRSAFLADDGYASLVTEIGRQAIHADHPSLPAGDMRRFGLGRAPHEVARKSPDSVQAVDGAAALALADEEAAVHQLLEVAEPGALGGVGHLDELAVRAAAVGGEVLEELALSLVEAVHGGGDGGRRGRGAGLGPRRVDAQVLGARDVALAQDRRALDHVAQLAHVARPGVPVERRPSPRRERRGAPADAPARVDEEVLDERGDLLAPLAQRRAARCAARSAGSRGPRGSGPRRPPSRGRGSSRR